MLILLQCLEVWNPSGQVWQVIPVFILSLLQAFAFIVQIYKIFPGPHGVCTLDGMYQPDIYIYISVNRYF